MNEEEKKVLMDHEYDGIQEFNFALPKWWQATFWGGIIFGIGYIVYYIFLNGPSLKHEYYADQEKMKTIKRKYMTSLLRFDEDKLNAFVADESMRLYGQSVFENNCRACHNKNAAGDIGPNLTDKYWIYTDGTHKATYRFIIRGNPINGMPSWGPVLSKEEIYAVSAYVVSMQGYEHTNPQAKAPQGDEY
jgi:cytochrome c oxidase cbb3-type subunit 3